MYHLIDPLLRVMKMHETSNIVFKKKLLLFLFLFCSSIAFTQRIEPMGDSSVQQTFTKEKKLRRIALTEVRGCLAQDRQGHILRAYNI